MARYDRIAQISAPVRDRAFPGWPILRDCESNARDADGARRARLRFLTLRPVLRVATRGIGAVQRESLLMQVERVADELTQLPARDPERAQLRHIADALHEGALDGIGRALLDYVDFAMTNATPGAAEEFATCCVELMRKAERADFGAAALISISNVMMVTDRPAAAVDFAVKACDLCEKTGDRAGWLRAVGCLALAHHANDESARADELLTLALRRARDWNDDALIGVVHAQFCRAAHSIGQYEAAVDHGWSALRTLEGGVERTSTLLLMAEALAQVELWRAADRCFALVSQHARDHTTRAAAAAGSALCAARDRDLSRLHERRTSAVREMVHLPVYARAAVHATLASAALLSEDLQLARTHIGDAVGLTAHGAPAELRLRIERVVTAFEAHAHEFSRATVRPVTDTIRKIAAELEQASDPLAPAR